MGYRIDFAVRDDTVAAIVSGRTSSAASAGSIAADIAEAARREAGKKVLIDLRRLRNRVGSLGALLLSRGGRAAAQRVAVVDIRENDPYYVFHELAARGVGCELRYFDDAGEALDWLHEAR
jgi:hypothetical protein